MAGPQRFFDPSQPQTLQIATMLLYLDAVFAFLGLLLLYAVGYGAAGYGMANGKKWGYGLALAVAVSAARPAHRRLVDRHGDPLPDDRPHVLGGPAGPPAAPPEPRVPEDLVLVIGGLRPRCPRTSLRRLRRLVSMFR